MSRTHSSLSFETFWLCNPDLQGMFRMFETSDILVLRKFCRLRHIIHRMLFDEIGRIESELSVDLSRAP